MTDEQLAANYPKPETLTDEQLAAAISEEDLEIYIKFSYNNGADVWRNVLTEVARRVRGIRHQLRHGDFDETVRRAHVVCDMWEHYEHAREKHPYFCDHESPELWSVDDAKKYMGIMRNHLRDQTASGNIHWDTVLECEEAEVLDAIIRGDKPAAVEECFDAIAVLLRVIDVLEGRQKLGKPEAKHD